LPVDGLFVLDSCAVVALLQREPGAEVMAEILRNPHNHLTSDHHELDPIAQAAICPVRFIR
jgi:uncharacterized protein with PIN domain